ncbi:unnamed protein product [Phytophthora fragariaefolia]|uniref:Unnamed protein product n=1 Tax=Phytophthora fragariaefolia TaxID=1490495 RepID=A0A9W7DD57_9STRA|nr:unnamed protein product [Phytophthora fragariaefolia]
MPKTNSKSKKAPRATEATPPEAVAAAEEPSPKEATTPRVNGATSVKSGPHATKGKPAKAHAPATTTAPSAKSTRRTRANKRKEVRLPGPFRGGGGSPAPRATEPSEGESAAANTTASEPTPVMEAAVPSPDGASGARQAEDFLNSSDSQDQKSSASTTSPPKAPQEPSSPPADGPDPVDYEESEPDQDREQGEVPDPNSSPQLTEQQRVTHRGSPMTPKTVAAVARVEAQSRRQSPRDTASTVEPEQQIITNAGVDEGVPPEQLQPDNRRHLREPAGTKREREASTPRTREELLALRYWTLDEYREHLRLSWRPGPGVSQCDKCPVVLWDDTGLTRQTNEREFEDWLRFLGYACPEFLASPYRIDWLAQRRLRFRMAKMVADGQWQSRYFDRHMPTPPVILEEVIQKIQKSWQSQPIEPRSVLGRVSADQLRGPAQKRPRGRRSPPRGDSLAPMSYRYQGSRATSSDTGSSRYARGASVASRHGSRGHPQYQEAEAELGGEADRDAPRRWPEPRGDALPVSSSESRGGLLSAVESCQRLLDAQRADLVTLRGRLQTVESLAEAGREVPEDLRRLRHRVQGLPEQVDHLGRELDRVSCRLSQCEGVVGVVRHSLSEHLGWIRTLYSRVGTLESRDARRQADHVARSAPAPAPAREELLEVMASALRQYSAEQHPRGRSPQPDGTAKADQRRTSDAWP